MAVPAATPAPVLSGPDGREILDSRQDVTADQAGDDEALDAESLAMIRALDANG